MLTPGSERGTEYMRGFRRNDAFKNRKTFVARLFFNTLRLKHKMNKSRSKKFSILFVKIFPKESMQFS